MYMCKETYQDGMFSAMSGLGGESRSEINSSLSRAWPRRESPSEINFSLSGRGGRKCVGNSPDLVPRAC